MADRTICVVTGARAEYGLLRPLLIEIAGDPALRLQLIVTGSHLETRFGNTVSEVEADGFTISAQVAMNLADDEPLTIAKSIGLATGGMADALSSLSPDCVVLLGDRFEVLAAAQAAMVLGIPIAHIHGGEATEGAIDEAIRHAVTKMSHLHFTSAEVYRQRVIQLGEQPATVYDVGALCLDSMATIDYLSRDALADELSFDIKSNPYFLVTYHPATLSKQAPADCVRELLAALDEFPAHHVLITGANADPRNESINNLMKTFQESQPDRVLWSANLGQARYFSAMKYASAVVGNSSSGIIEAPALRIPTVNLGPRQKGRVRADSIIDCEENKKDVSRAIREALAIDRSRESFGASYPFGQPGAARRIRNILKTADFGDVGMKSFYDLPLASAITAEVRV